MRRRRRPTLATAVCRSKSLQQLCFKDARRFSDTYLYKLAHSPTGLGLFTNVLVISSPQDRYVPYCSARVEPLAPWRPKDDRWREHARMARALFSPLLRALAGGEARAGKEGGVGDAPATAVRGVRARCDVAFDWPRASSLRDGINKALGRAAHIELVDNEAYITLLLTEFPTLFE